MAEGSDKRLSLSSPAFSPGGRIPRRYAYRGEGDNVSPPLRWSGAPAGTRSFALICDDPDAPRAEPWVHWVVYNIPAEATELPEGSAGGAALGVNDFEEQGWGGPMPPRGHGTHHYHFKLYALDTLLEPRAGMTKKGLLRAMQGHILAEAELVGTYERR
ncbi:MAG: hypothetical protein KatS3mg102_2569 [Planctomycetota bacterium]|nr:MAG: hypothetical protein KatS3mg102_2569 [Planctomycetota bacterium]